MKQIDLYLKFVFRARTTRSEHKRNVLYNLAKRRLYIRHYYRYYSKFEAKDYFKGFNDSLKFLDGIQLFFLYESHFKAKSRYFARIYDLEIERRGLSTLELANEVYKGRIYGV